MMKFFLQNPGFSLKKQMICSWNWLQTCTTVYSFLRYTTSLYVVGKAFLKIQSFIFSSTAKKKGGSQNPNRRRNDRQRQSGEVGTMLYLEMQPSLYVKNAPPPPTLLVF